MIRVRDTMTTVCFYSQRGIPRRALTTAADTHSRGGYGYASPPRRGHPAPFPPSRRAPPDPHTFDYPASLKQYAEWFRFFYPQQAIEEDNADKAAEQEAADGSKPRNGIKSKWDKYKKDFAASQVSIPHSFSYPHLVSVQFLYYRRHSSIVPPHPVPISRIPQTPRGFFCEETERP